jgi:hypothetical protein
MNTKAKNEAVLQRTCVKYVQGYIQKFPDWVDNEINNNNKHLLRSNTKGYGSKTH